jgi:hypothetical protein
VSTNLKMSKTRSCRGAIDLQLSQRATYVLMFSLKGKTRRRCNNSRPGITVRTSFKSNLSGFALKIGMSANYKKCVPGDNEELLYWPILNFYSKIWRTCKKTESAFWSSRDLTMNLNFDKGFLCKRVPNHVKHI